MACLLPICFCELDYTLSLARYCLLFYFRENPCVRHSFSQKTPHTEQHNHCFRMGEVSFFSNSYRFSLCIFIEYIG